MMTLYASERYTKNYSLDYLLIDCMINHSIIDPIYSTVIMLSEDVKRSLHILFRAKQRLRMTYLHSYRINEYTNKQFLPIEMFSEFMFSFPNAKLTPLLGVIYFLIITCSLNGCYILPLLKVKCK